MIITKEIHQLVNSYMNIHCKNTHCQKQIRNIYSKLIELLSSDKVENFRYVGLCKLSYSNGPAKKLYQITLKNRKFMKIGFTGMSSIQVFSKRNRSTYCYSNEFCERVEKLLEE